MELWKIYTALLLLLSLSACKKDSQEALTEKEFPPRIDSLSFSINGKMYVFDEKNSVGFGNRQVNIKPYDAEINGRVPAYATGNKFWYGDLDSTLYDAFFAFNQHIKLSFSRKFHNNELKKSTLFLIPDNYLSLFRKGQQRFAVDLNMENSTDGVALEVLHKDFPGRLTSYRPGFSILMRPEMPKNIQDNSMFEIVKMEKYTDNRMVVYARFEMNLFDEDGNLYRLEKGFARFKTIITLNNDWDAVLP